MTIVPDRNVRKPGKAEPEGANLSDKSFNMSDNKNTLPAQERSLPQVIMATLASDGYQAGQRIPTELELAARFEVSRPAIREALRSLEGLGFLEARRGSGRILRPFDFSALRGWLPYIIGSGGSSLLDLLRVRQVLEVGFLGAAAARLGRGTLEELAALADVMTRKAAAGQTFVEEDHAFHMMLHEGLGNSILTVIVSVYWDAFESICEPAPPDAQRLAETAQHHAMIASALLAGDIAKAQYHMDAHFYDVAARLAEQHRGPSNPLASPGPGDLRMLPT